MQGGQTRQVKILELASRFLMAAGDPCQLPPVIASPAQVTPPGLSGSLPSGTAPGGRPSLHGLLRPLFVRLVQLGHQPYVLRKQYRWDPQLAEDNLHVSLLSGRIKLHSRGELHLPYLKSISTLSRLRWVGALFLCQS